MGNRYPSITELQTLGSRYAVPLTAIVRGQARALKQQLDQLVDDDAVYIDPGEER
jgi:hypothetical protein